MRCGSCSVTSGVGQSIDISQEVKTGDDCKISGFITIAGNVNIGDRAKLCGEIAIADNVAIGDNVKLCGRIAVAENASIGDNVIMSGNVIVGEGVIIADNVRIRGEDGVEIGSASAIEDNVLIGYGNLTNKKYEGQLRISIGDHNIIRPNTIIYKGFASSKNVRIASNCVVREFVTLGEGVVIGNNVVLDGYSSIGDRSIVHSLSLVTARTVIEEDVFLSVGVVTANGQPIDHNRPELQKTRDELGPTIRKGARVGAGAIILPRTQIGIDGVIAAGEVAGGIIPQFKIHRALRRRLLVEVPEEEILPSNLGAYEASHQHSLKTESDVE